MTDHSNKRSESTGVSESHPMDSEHQQPTISEENMASEARELQRRIIAVEERENALSEREKALSERESSLGTAQTDIRREAKKLEATTGLREFVSDTLRDILEGVDEIAVISRTSELTTSAEGYIHSTGAVGTARDSSDATEHVLFDIEVMVSSEQAGKDTGRVDLKVGTNFVFASAQLSGEGASERGFGMTRQASNRIQFRVPITYAKQREEDEV